MLHGKFKQIKVKTKIINGSPAQFISGWKQLSAYLALCQYFTEKRIIERNYF